VPSGGEIHEVAFEKHNHHHGHMDLGADDDAHARAHAEDIRRRFAGRQVTIGQIVLFGLTGGLIPCPAAITVLLLCIQLKQFSLGFAPVVCFSVGFALTMVWAGVLIALGVKHVASRWSGFSSFARRAPYASAALVVLYMGWLGWRASTTIPRRNRPGSFSRLVPRESGLDGLDRPTGPRRESPSPSNGRCIGGWGRDGRGCPLGAGRASLQARRASQRTHRAAIAKSRMAGFWQCLAPSPFGRSTGALRPQSR
jgi:hypothetical protein